MVQALSFTDSVSTIMTDNPVCVRHNTLMTEVVGILEREEFHNIPVVDDADMVVGIISKSDVLQLQDKFTRFNCLSSELTNKKYFKSLLVSEVMTPNPISVSSETGISELIDLFIESRVRSVVVLDNGKCLGIVTPYDILLLLTDMEMK